MLVDPVQDAQGLVRQAVVERFAGGILQRKGSGQVGASVLDAEPPLLDRETLWRRTPAKVVPVWVLTINSRRGDSLKDLGQTLVQIYPLEELLKGGSGRWESQESPR